MIDNEKINDRQPAPIPPTMGERLNAIRKELKVTEKEFTDRLHISETEYEQIVDGTINPDYAFLERLVLEYDVNLYYLMFGWGYKLGGHCETCSFKIPLKTFVDIKEIHKFIRYFGQSALVQYHMMAQFLSLYRVEKEAIEQDILPASEV